MSRLNARVQKLEKHLAANIGKKWAVYIFVEAGETNQEAIRRHLAAHPADAYGPFLICTEEARKFAS